MLGEAVRADKTVIVAPNGFTEGALAKAKVCRMDCRTWTLEEALEFMVEDFWKMCPACRKDCIVMDQGGLADWGGMWLWWLAGACRNCRTGRVWCQDCGLKMLIAAGSRDECTCGFIWEVTPEGEVLPPRMPEDGEDWKDPHPGHPTLW